MRKNNRRNRLWTASTVLVAGGVMLLPDAAVAQPAMLGTPAQISGHFQLVNLQTGKCATVAGGVSTDNNHPLVQFTCDTDPSRRWIVTNGNGISNQLVNEQTRKCLTVAGGVSTDNNHPLVQFTCDTDPSRRWRLINVNGSVFQIVNMQTGKCLTVAGGVSTDNNHPLVQFTCDTDLSRRWVLRRVGGTID
ncbi:RICIN domain-containing protein [Streptomyces sp. NPDC058000]|uniref:RICIN domain-containing protein n=1 Tax=Streptomyces sp. NPDC058000 TaxID=3346299 RepID=UPI0036E04422